MKPLNNCDSISSYTVSTSYVSPEVGSDTAARNQRLDWLRSRLKSLLVTASKLFNTTHEPRISKRFDRWGNIYFAVYDPANKTHQVFTSEQEVRIWLEQRYYQL